MSWKNTPDQWGRVSASFHWLTVFAVVGLFLLGLWMVDLTYYDPWYQTGPYVHKSTGVLLFCLMLLRLIWRTLNPTPLPLPSHTVSEQMAAKVVHGGLYLLLFTVMISGYLISTADGRAIEVFGGFELPATISGFDGQEDVAGEIHLYAAYTLVTVAVLHAFAALKHHFVDRDRTLLRMLGRS